MKKGQVATEFLVLIAVIFLLFSVLIVVVQEQKIGIERTRYQNDAVNTVGQISAAANDVYSQGEGARRKIFVQIPLGYESNQSYVSNKTINLRVAGSDYAASTNFDVRGSFPTTPGGHWVWIISEGNKVRIGSVMFTVDKQSIYKLMNKGTSLNDTVKIENVFGSQINGTITLYWTPTDATVTINSTSFVLDDSKIHDLGLAFTAGQNSGFYSGSIVITANGISNFSSSTETVTIPITVEVAGGDITPPLQITPESWSRNITVGSGDSQTFNVCTNSETTVDWVSFTSSPGNPGSWISGTENLGAMSPNDCLTKVLNVSIPNGTTAQLYTGFVTVLGSGGEQDILTLIFNAVSNGTDIEGPLATNLALGVDPVFSSGNAIITATCDDTGRGNSAIGYSEVKLNSGSWLNMSASDGTFNSVTEAVTYTVSNLQFGSNNVSVRCTDVPGNTGPESSFTFKGLKEIAFVSLSNGLNTYEQRWMNWITGHSSAAGFSWSLDQIKRQDVIDGTTDLTNYLIVIMPDDLTSGSSGDNFENNLQDFLDEGGYAVLLGKAMNSIDDLGFGDTIGRQSQHRITIDINTHYITSPFVLDELPVYTSSNYIWYTHNYAGLPLATDGFTYASNGDHVMLGADDAEFVVVWGAERPDRFTSNGDTVSTRVLDHSLLESNIRSS